jgi:DNA-binding MarR family transcriptional regulator
MSQSTHDQWPKAYKRYCNNLFRHLTFIDQYLHRRLNEQLEHVGYTGVKMAFIQVIPYLGEEGARAAQLARLHQMPVATMAKLIKDVESQGYVRRQADPTDSRAKQLFATAKAMDLARDALNISQQLALALGDTLGDEGFTEFCSASQLAFEVLQLELPAMVKSHSFGSAGLLQFRLNHLHRYVEQILLEKNLAHGYTELQNSYHVILGNLSDEGTRIIDIAKKEGMSKQHVGEIAANTIKTGFVTKVPDPVDRRSQRLVFTDKGREMIIFAMKNVDSLENKLEKAMGHNKFQSLLHQASRLWYLLGGQGPDQNPPAGKLPDSLEPLLTQWVNLLPSLIEEHPKIALVDVFRQYQGKRQLRTEFIEKLSNLRL